MKTQHTILGLVLLFGLVGLASADTLSVTLGSPTDNFWSQSNTVTLNCSCTGNQTTGYDLIWWIDGVNVSSNTSIDNNTPTYYAYTFSSDQCSGASWNCQCNSSNQSATNGTARTIKTDTHNPTVSYDHPTSLSVKRGKILEFTTSDNCGVDTRWWTKDGGVTNSTSFINTDDIDTTTWLKGEYTVSLFVKDNSGRISSENVSDLIVRSRSSLGVIPTQTTIPLGATPSPERKDLVRDLYGLLLTPLVLGGLSIPLWIPLLLVIVAVVMNGGTTKKRRRKPRRRTTRRR